MDLRALAVAALAVVALMGIAFAAEAQLETFLKPEDVATGFDERSAVQGNLVAVTGLLVAAAIAAIGAVMARGPIRHRIAPVMTLFVSAYLLVLLMQTAMFYYIADDLNRAAVFSVSPVLFNGTAAPSVYIGPLALIMAAAIGIATASSRLLGTSRDVTTPRGAMRQYMAAFALGVPFLAILVWGNLQVLLALPHEESGTLPYLLILPLSGLAAIALLVMGLVKVWQLGVVVRTGASGLVAHDAWIALRRGELAAIGVLVAVAMAGSALDPLPLAILEAGRVFGLTARSHSQASFFLLVTLLPALLMQNPVLRVLRAQDTLEGRQQAPSTLLILAYLGVVAAGVAGAGLATWLVQGVLWAWVYAALPVAVFALVALRPGDGLLPAMLPAVLLWAIGNTVTGSFQLTTNSAVEYHTAPGLLALWRAAAVLLVAWAVARAARARTDTVGRSLAWPLTAGIGAAVALIIFLQLPFSAWVIFVDGAQFVGIGTVVASQDAPVRAVIHVLTGAGAFLAGLAVSRLHRPEWFRSKAAALPALPAAEGQA